MSNMHKQISYNIQLCTLPFGAVSDNNICAFFSMTMFHLFLVICMSSSSGNPSLLLLRGVQHNFLNTPQNISFKSIS